LFSTVKEKLERIHLADEDQFFECLQEVLRGLDQQELNRVFQASVRRVQELSEGKAMEATSDDEQVLSIKVLRIFIRRAGAYTYRSDDIKIFSTIASKD
jgi:hypothetical protein